LNQYARREDEEYTANLVPIDLRQWLQSLIFLSNAVFVSSPSTLFLKNTKIQGDTKKNGNF
jgi:predicted Co/Zn/Cd cation transporter (cation efflux family)